MKNLDNIAEELFNKIRGRFPGVTIGNGDGEVTNVPTDARFFDFEYKESDRVLGQVSISIDEENLSVMYGDDFVANEDSATRDNWYNFLKELRTFSKKRMLNFDTRNITKSNLDKRDYDFLATNRSEEDQMNESKMYGTNKTSFQKIGNAKLSIKHTEAINTESATARSQKISAIFVENAEGEKFKYPYKHLSGARAMARHVAEGGNPYDDFGKHITGLSEELSKLRKFNSYMKRSSVMAESLAGYVDVVKERAANIKKEIQNLQKESFYKEAAESYEAPVLEDVPNDVAENWIDQLTIKQFNEELQDVFPYIYNLVSEATKAEELGPDQLDEGIVDWIKSKWQDFQQARADRQAQYEAQLNMMTQIMQDNGMDDFAIRRIIDGCLNDPRVCMYNHIRKSGFGHKFHNELQDVYQELKGGLTTRSGTTDEAIDDAFEELMGQFSEKETDADEGNAFAHAVRQAKMNGKKKGDEIDGPDGEKIKIEQEDDKTPLGEFILSYFDYTTGNFPKGETAVLTMVEKDYGEEFINPAKQFIERINSRVAEVIGYRDPELMDTLTPTDDEWSKTLQIPNRETWEKLIKQAKAKGDKEMLGKLMAMGYKEEPEVVVQDNSELDSIRSLAGL